MSHNGMASIKWFLAGEILKISIHNKTNFQGLFP